MPFVDETGNSGLSKAVQGMAQGFETARRIQDSQQAREMAMKELELRQDRTDLAFDRFSEQLRHNKEQGERADLRLASGIEADKAQQGLAESKFNFLKKEANRERDLMTARGEAMSLMLKHQGDDAEWSGEEVDLLTESLRHLPPEVQAGTLIKVKEIQRARERQLEAERRQSLERSTRYLIENAASDEERVARIESLRAAEVINGAGTAEHFEAVREIEQTAWATGAKRKDLVRWGEDADTLIRMAIKDDSERSEAFMLHHQIAELTESNPLDPRIEEMKERVEWLSVPKAQRTKFEEADKENKILRHALTTQGATDGEQASRLVSASRVQSALLSGSVTAGFAKSEEQRAQMLTAAFKDADFDIKLDVLLPPDVALPQQLAMAFQGMQAAGVAIGDEGMDPKAVAAHMANLLERAGIQPDDPDAAEEDQPAWQAFKKWSENPTSLEQPDLDPMLIAKANVYKAEKRKERAKDGDPNRLALKWMQKFKANKVAKEGGAKTKRMPFPPKGIEDQARSMGWKPKQIRDVQPTVDGKPVFHVDAIRPDGSLSTYLKMLTQKNSGKIRVDGGWARVDKKGNVIPFYRAQTREENEAEFSGEQ